MYISQAMLLCAKFYCYVDYCYVDYTGNCKSWYRTVNIAIIHTYNALVIHVEGHTAESIVTPVSVY